MCTSTAAHDDLRATAMALLCSEAERQLVERGVAEVSMRDLARAVGRSVTWTYRYFPNKEALLAAVRAAIVNRLCERLETIAAQRLDAVSWARAHTEAFVNFACDEPHAYRLVFDLYQPLDAADPVTAQVNERLARVSAGYVRQMRTEGLVRGNPDELGYLYFATVHGLIVLHLTGRPRASRAAFDQICRTCLRVITRGMRAIL